MDHEIFERIKTKEILACLVDENGAVLWQTSESPVGKLYKDYLNQELTWTENMILYANQAGIAMGIMAEKIPIKICHAVRMSEGGLEKFEENHVEVDYETLIPFVKSSKDEAVVCPIEKHLYEHKDPKERWDFLEDRFKNDDGAHRACAIRKNKN